MEVTRLRHVGNGFEQLTSEWADLEPLLGEQGPPVRLGLRVHVHEAAFARLRRGEHDNVAEAGETFDEPGRAARSQMLGDLDAESEVEAADVGHSSLQVRARDLTAELGTRDCGPAALDSLDVDPTLRELGQHQPAARTDVDHAAGRPQANQGVREPRVRVQLHRIALGVEALVVDEVARGQKRKPAQHLAQRVPDRAVDPIEADPEWPADSQGQQTSKRTADLWHGREAYGDPGSVRRP
jgi:hypothetical protein